MKSTSPGCSAESMAAKSPGLSIEGPLAVRKLTFISLDIICAKVVLPRPGGP